MRNCQHLILEQSNRSDNYIRNELESVEHYLTRLGVDAVISNDYKSITFRARSGEKLTVRVEKLLVPEYHLINDFGDDVYISTSKSPNELAYQILNEYTNN